MDIYSERVHGVDTRGSAMRAQIAERKLMEQMHG